MLPALSIPIFMAREPSGQAPCRKVSRAMINRWISEAPSSRRVMRASRA
jgi:hypothetical protein